MRRYILLLLATSCMTGLQARYLHHEVHASIDHAAGAISVIDTISIPASRLQDQSTLVFSLHSGLKIHCQDPAYQLEPLEAPEAENYKLYRITTSGTSAAELKIPLQYSGTIRDEISTGAAEYARGFSDTDGMISDEGIYLAGATHWIPSVEGMNLFTFGLHVEMDEPWGLVSQGTRTLNEAKGSRRLIRYESPEPMDEIYLIAGQWTEYSRPLGDVLVQAFLRTADEALAHRYLGVTSHYLELYENLIGEYPFSKFALVENFWETGYGMPSFTLLGPKVIRFPWILHSSYPHELLHNYWGNSVYVDYEKGNWCEGITAYMADHLIKEQQGLGADYRRNTLQKYTDYVHPENDFPPAEFISRNNAAEEAVGYGKVLMFNNMLRDELGDEIFLQAYADFYERMRFHYAGFDDIRHSFEKASGTDLGPMFEQWIHRKGAPSLALSGVETGGSDGAYHLRFSLSQVQEDAIFKVNVPVAVWLEGEEEVRMIRVEMNERESHFAFDFAHRPLKLSIDPQFNLMRTLDRSEVPSTLSQVFGARKAMLVLPKESPMLEAYRALADMWKQTQEAQGKALIITHDADLEQLPSDLPVWVFGYDNRLYAEVEIGQRYREHLQEGEWDQIRSLSGNNTLVYALPGSSPDQTIGFVGTHSQEALKGLGRKLFHYGSYGYLGFDGDAPDNVLKGVFPVLDSKMERVMDYPDHPVANQPLPVRNALGSVGKTGNNAHL